MNEIQTIEREIAERVERLIALRKAAAGTPVRNYTFDTVEGPVTLRQLFGEKTILFALHNMGQGCRYCTLWADGFAGLVPHIESEFAFVVLTRDPPEVQRAFANARGWRFRMASHGGGAYIREQSVDPGEDNMPGANSPGMVCYERRGDEIFRKNATGFGPGDMYSPLWHILSLAGRGWEDWTPQYAYWKRPGVLDDGGKNVVE